EIIIQGRGGHGASPHETKDAIMIGSHLVTKLQQIVSRRIDPLDTAVVTVGVFEAGDAFNIIADQAKIIGNVRYLDKDVQNQIKYEMETIIKGVCDSFHATYTFSYEKGYPPVLNHEKEAELILNIADQMEEIHTSEQIRPVMGAEDFAYFLH